MQQSVWHSRDGTDLCTMFIEIMEAETRERCTENSDESYSAQSSPATALFKINITLASINMLPITATQFDDTATMYQI